MRLLASHTVRGNKSLRFYVGDLSSIPPDEAVDLLMVSAFPDDYAPTRTSLIGALHRRGVSVEELAEDKEADLRESFSSWMSNDLSARFPRAGFKRILCFESALSGPAQEIVGDVFRAVLPFAFGEPHIRTIAMPLLATGDQGCKPELILRSIFDAATHWLGAGLPVDTVKLVVHEASLGKRLSKIFAQLSEGEARTVDAVMAEPTGYDYFISYAHADVAEVDDLIRSLRTEHPQARIFQDKLALDTGQSWQVELDSALESSRHVITFYSPSYLQSKMCIEEFNMARIRHRESAAGVLRPVYLRSAVLPLYMRTLQYIDCREADRQLFSNAARTLARGALAAPFRG